MLISVADRFQDVPERIATRPFPEEHKVPACESQAYVWAEPLGDGTLKFHFAVENPQGISAKAMAVILDEALSGEPPEEVARVSGEVVYESSAASSRWASPWGSWGWSRWWSIAPRRCFNVLGQSAARAPEPGEKEMNNHPAPA